MHRGNSIFISKWRKIRIFEFYSTTLQSQEHLSVQLLTDEPHTRTTSIVMFETMFWHNSHVHMQNCSQRRFMVSDCAAGITLHEWPCVGRWCH